MGPLCTKADTTTEQQCVRVTEAHEIRFDRDQLTFNQLDGTIDDLKRSLRSSGTFIALGDGFRLMLLSENRIVIVNEQAFFCPDLPIHRSGKSAEKGAWSDEADDNDGATASSSGVVDETAAVVAVV